jgi:hypothetical protein
MPPPWSSFRVTATMLRCGGINPTTGRSSNGMARVAYVHFPYWPDQARLETMPFSLNSVMALANAQLDVDLYLCERDASIYAAVLPGNVTLRQLPPIDEETQFALEEVHLDAAAAPTYACAFGLGQIGIVLAARRASRSRCPLVFLNDEFPSNTPPNVWAEREMSVAQSVDLFVVSDAARARALLSELRVPQKPFAALPNVTNLKEWPRIDWHARLQVPSDSKLFMYAGTLGDWAHVPDIVATVHAWPSNALMIVHSRSAAPGHEAQFRQEGRVISSVSAMPEPLLNSLTSACAGTFGLYFNQGPNTETMGFSSGKLMRSIACGTPVIASRYASLSYIEENKLGVLVSEPGEVPAAVAQVLANDDEYRQQCRRFHREHLSFDRKWAGFCEALAERTGFRVPTARMESLTQ